MNSGQMEALEPPGSEGPVPLRSLSRPGSCLTGSCEAAVNLREGTLCQNFQPPFHEVTWLQRRKELSMGSEGWREGHKWAVSRAVDVGLTECTRFGEMRGGRHCRLQGSHRLLLNFPEKHCFRMRGTRL